MGGFRAGGGLEAVDTTEEQDLDDAPSLALTVDWERSPDRFYQLFYGRQATEVEGGAPDVSVEYLHFGGRLAWPQGGFSTYLGGGFGATRLNPDGSADNEIRPSMSLAGGIGIPVAERLEIRLELRGYLTFTGGDEKVLCAAESGESSCRLRYRGEILGQVEAMAGLTYRF